MAGKYRVECVVTLRTEISPQSGTIMGVEDVDAAISDYEDVSSWDSNDVRCEGGVIDFTVEADSEDEAREIAERAMGNAYFDGDDFEWEVDDYSISSIECIEEPWDMERATSVIRAFLARMREMGGVTAEEEEAFSFLLDHITP